VPYHDPEHYPPKGKMLGCDLALFREIFYQIAIYVCLLLEKIRRFEKNKPLVKIFDR
jgi:hypothetical protein